MSEQKKIVLKIESRTLGHETVSMTVNDAMNRVQSEVSERGKWLYCDGAYTKVDTATAEGRTRLSETLSNAQDVTLAGTLLGG